MTTSCITCDRPVDRRGQACDHCIADAVHASRTAQGLEPTATDPVAADKVATILIANTPAQPATTRRRKAKAS